MDIKAFCDIVIKNDDRMEQNRQIQKEDQLHKAERLLVDILEGKYKYYQSGFEEDGSFNPDYYEMIEQYFEEKE